MKFIIGHIEHKSIKSPHTQGLQCFRKKEWMLFFERKKIAKPNCCAHCRTTLGSHRQMRSAYEDGRIEAKGVRPDHWQTPSLLHLRPLHLEEGCWAKYASTKTGRSLQALQMDPFCGKTEPASIHRIPKNKNWSIFFRKGKCTQMLKRRCWVHIQDGLGTLCLKTKLASLLFNHHNAVHNSKMLFEDDFSISWLWTCFRSSGNCSKKRNKNLFVSHDWDRIKERRYAGGSCPAHRIVNHW